MFRPFGHHSQSTVAGTVAILPLGAMESHGPHLPLATDTIIVDGILDRAAAEDKSPVSVLRLPALWIGASAEHADRAGTVSLEPEEVIAHIVAAGAGLARANVSRLILFNGHGGNVAAAGIAALKLRTHHDMLVANVHWLDFGLPPDMTSPAPVASDVHGGWIETSVLLHLAPALVAMRDAKAQDAAPPAPSLYPQGPIAWGWKTADLAPGGWIGRPDLATAECGRALVDHAAARLLGLVNELAAATWPPR